MNMYIDRNIPLMKQWNTLKSRKIHWNLVYKNSHNNSNLFNFNSHDIFQTAKLKRQLNNVSVDTTELAKKKKKKTLHIYLWNNTALAAMTNTCGRVASLRIAQLDRSTLCGAGRTIRIANITLRLTRTRGVAGLASLATGSFPGQKNRREKIYIHKMQSRVIS